MLVGTTVQQRLVVEIGHTFRPVARGTVFKLGASYELGVAPAVNVG